MPKARRENRRKKHLSAALATAVVAGPATPLAAAQVSSGNLSAAVAAESPANRAIEIREGGLPLRAGSQGDLVVQVQRALHVDVDGIFGVQTDAAVRSWQRAKGLDVDGIVGLATWGSLFPGQTHGVATGAAIGGSNIPAAAQAKVEQTVEQAGTQLAAQGDAGLSGTVGTTPVTNPQSTVPHSNPQSTPVASPTPGTTTVQGCGSTTIVRPVNGTVTSDYGPRWGRNHDGLDIGAPTGTPVRAAACGTVSLAGQQSGYGNIICITHTSQFSTCYAHLSRFGVSNGARVQQGQVIGYVGCTGSCTGPHLHFETRVGGTARDPKTYLGGASMPGAASTKATAASASTRTATATAATTAAGDGTVTTSTEAGTLSNGTAPAPTETDTTVTGTAPAEPVPATTVPAEAAPDATVPAEAAPDATVPAEAAPVEPVPAEAAPATTVPAEAAPVEPVPAEAAPAATVPAEAVPTAAVPAEAAPTATVPVEPAPVEAAPAAAVPVEPVAAPASTLATTDGSVTTGTETGAEGDGTVTGGTGTDASVSGGVAAGVAPQ